MLSIMLNMQGTVFVTCGSYLQRMGTAALRTDTLVYAAVVTPGGVPA